MSRPLKILGIVVGVVLVILLLVPFLIDVDKYRPRITAEVESRTGRKLEIGKIRARLLPTAGFTIEDVTLGPPVGFADVNLLKADKVSGSVSLSALFRGEVDVSSIEIEKPHVVLATDERGRTNYDFSAPASAGHKPAAPASSSSSSFVLDSVAIKGAELDLVDVRAHRAGSPSVKLSGVNLDMSQLDFSAGGMKNWKGSVPLSGVKLEVAGLPPVTFRSGDLRLENGAAAGKCEADLGDAARVKGDFSIPSLEKGVLEFTLATPLLDLDHLVAATPSAGKTGGAGQPPPVTAAPAGHSELVAKGKITAEKLRWAPYEATNFSADVRAYSDRVEMPVTMAVYGGSLGITTRLDRTQVPQRFSANIQVSQLDLEKLVSADPATRGKITGRGEMKMQVLGSLSASLKNSLSGQGSFALRDGRLPGVSLGKSMQALSQVQRVLNLGQTGGGGSSETTFSAVQGDLAIRAARLYTERTHAVTNVGSGDIRGSIGFDQTLDLTGNWALAPGVSQPVAAGVSSIAGGVLGGVLGKTAGAAVGGGNMSIPFTVKGTLKDPKLTPGGGIPGFKSAAPAQSSTQQPQKKKSILDVFGKP
jgi:uncharacterized protein involved in outer membrane biogenesis